MKSRKKKEPFTIILTGLSGAGKTVALNAFEDSGFFCVDNLPTTLIENFVELSEKTPTLKKIAIGVDIRERKFLGPFPDIITSLRTNHKVQIIFLDAKRNVLLRRFKETRRPHPLGSQNLLKAIIREKSHLSKIRNLADLIIDTSTLNPHQLRNFISTRYAERKNAEMSISLISFGFKYGTPSELDLLFDVRFLPNPYFIKELKDYPGTSPKVRKFVLAQKDSESFFKKVIPLLKFLIPLYKKEGRSYLNIGIGCTGGRHRSPAICEEIKKILNKQSIDIALVHRDIDI